MMRLFTLGGLLALAMGCKTVEPHQASGGNSVIRQSGAVEVFQTADGIQVAYPQPFSKTPQLTLGNGKEDVELLDQQPDHFRVRWKQDGGMGTLSWRAEGSTGGR